MGLWLFFHHFPLSLLVDWTKFDRKSHYQCIDCISCLLSFILYPDTLYLVPCPSRPPLAEVIIVTPREYETHFTEFLSHYARSSSMSIDLVPVDDMMGSVDGLCAVSDRIRGDFIVVRSDFVSQFCLGELVSMHRMNSSDVTMLLTSVKSADVKKDEMDEELMGVCDDGRVVLKTFTNDIDEAVFLPKPLLQKCPTLSLRSDLTDVGVYVMSHWVMELLLMTSTKMASVQSDLVPFLVRRQFQPAEYLLKAMPALQHRGRPLEAIEPWLTATAATSAAALGKPSCTIGLGGRGGTAPAGGAGFPEEKEHLVVELLFNQAAMASPAAAAMGALPSAVSALSLSSPPPTPGGSAAAPLTPMTHSAAAASAGARVQATAVTGSGGVAVTEDISSCCPPPPAGPAAEHSSASTRPSHPSQQSPVRGAAVSGGRQMEADPLRCFAVIYEADGCGPSSSGGVALVAQPINNRGRGGGSVVNTAAASAAAGAGENSNSSSILSCVNCIGAYLNLNK